MHEVPINKKEGGEKHSAFIFLAKLNLNFLSWLLTYTDMARISVWYDL